ncbi:MAG: iron-containing alcohol dehydrogenase [Phycisphaerales bacterium]|nr:MAG: iron-containing alcohol dehydrogenase [Phycisphaerales bacterium]
MTPIANPIRVAEAPAPSAIGIPSGSQRIAWSIRDLPELLLSVGSVRPLLVIDTGAVQASGLRPELDELLSPAEVRLFDAFTPNPRCEEVAEAILAAADHDADAVVAIGGGSCLDVAKVAAMGARAPEHAHAIARGEAKPPQDTLPIIAAPTTAGTGSEATHFAAVYIGERKVSIGDPRMRPGSVILDVALHLSMPAMLAAQTGCDALGQALESIWAVGSTPASIQSATAAAERIVPSLAPSVTTGEIDARREMMVGAHLAGRAIDISKTTAAHALSYQLTQRFGIAHGHAVALTLGHIGAWNAGAFGDDCIDPRGPADVRDRVSLAASLLGVSPEGMPGAVRALLSKIGLPTTLKEAGVDAGAIADMASRVDPVRLSNNPRRFTGEELEALLHRAYNGD